MAVKYRLSFSNINLEQVVVEISHPDYVGDVISVIGVGGESYSLSRSAIDTPHASHVVPTTANINLYTDLIDVEELQQANDKEWTTRVTVDGDDDFIGYLVPDGIQKTLKGAGNVVRLNATCGLSLLQGQKYSYPSGVWTVDVGGNVSVNLAPMSFIRHLLAGVGTNLPICWSTSIRYDVEPDRDFFAGSMPFSSIRSLGEIFAFNDIDRYWFIENLVKSGKCTIVQQSGKWHIINYEDLIRLDGVLPMLEIPGGSGAVVATSYNKDFNLDLNGKQILDDAYTMFKKAVGKVNVVYNKIQNKNIIPNGGFDLTILGYVADWHLNTSKELVGTYEALDGRQGTSADVSRINPIGGAGLPADDFTTSSRMNFDAKVLFKSLTFGFMLMPLNGFEVDENGFIKWGIDTLKISLYYDMRKNGVLYRYYLNEFGYWSNGDMKGNQEVVDARFAPLNSRLIVDFNQDRNFFVGDEVVIEFYRNGGGKETHSVTFEETKAVGAGVTFLSTKITGSEVGSVPYSLWINNVNGSMPFSAKVVKTEDYYQDIRLNQDQAKIGDIINFTFQAKGKSTNILVPEPEDLLSGSGKMRLSFHVKSGQRYILDNVWMNVEDNSDRYELSNFTANSEEGYEMGISTSFSGFFISNYQETPGNAEKFMLMTDYSGTSKRLTELYGRGIFNWRNKARKIYNGTFKHDVPYISLVDIDGVKYIPTGMENNRTNGQCFLQGFEAALNIIEPNVVHKGNNDENLNK